VILDHTEQFIGCLAAGKKKISKNVRKLTKSDKIICAGSRRIPYSDGMIGWKVLFQGVAVTVALTGPLVARTLCPTVFTIYAILQRHSGARDTMLKTGKASCEQFV